MLLNIVIILQIVRIARAAFNEVPIEHSDGDVKLVDGSTDLEGSVLVFKGYAWGAVCDDGWSLREANVVCRQLGMGSAYNAYTNNQFRSRGLPYFLLDDVRCSGSEKRLNKCRFRNWGQHNCETNEVAGVRCSRKPPPLERNPNWNLLGVNATKEELERLRTKQYSIRFVRQEIDGTGVLVAKIGDTEGAVCPDNFRSVEGNVACKQLGHSYAAKFDSMEMNEELIPTEKHIVRVGRCYGNESQLYECISYASEEGVPCKSDKMVVVKCTSSLPDITPDVYEIERSSYSSELPLWLLECALSEKCLPDDVYTIIARKPNTYSNVRRQLLRFSSIIENVGTEPFLPLEKSENWDWHACHLHYHSMKVFARYEVIDDEKRLAAVGHKASFCLEDNVCKHGVTPHYACSNTADRRGSQGISPGCKDVYLHNYDCQWVDVTDLKPGQYTFQMILNPDFLVSESDFSNNGVSCRLYHTGMQSVLRNCRMDHPYNLI